MRPVTLAELLEKGATKFAFITPGEELPGMAPTLAGALAYQLDPNNKACKTEGQAMGKRAVYFPIAGT